MTATSQLLLVMRRHLRRGPRTQVGRPELGDDAKQEANCRIDYHLHEYILALWGMPLGEMLDLERLAQVCRQKNRWTFFFSSQPANCPAGVSSHVNGQAIL